MLAVLGMVPPSGGTNVNVAPLWKLLPLMVMVWLLLEAGYEDGTTLLMVGAGVDAAPSCVTVKVCPAIVIVPVRELVLVFDVTE